MTAGVTGAPPPPGRRDLALLVRKEAGLTSRDVVNRLIKKLGRRDVGHTGTLDPFATGLLILVVGRATKLVPFIHEWDKEYRATVRLGVATDTLDGTGAVTATAPVPPGAAGRIPPAVEALVGPVLQQPPAYSAVKEKGVRLYRLARRGIAVERKPRLRTVHSAVIENLEIPLVTLRVACSTGTYVRELARSLGERLDLPAHLLQLERTRIGPYRLEDALDGGEIDALDGQVIEERAIPMAEILGDWPVLAVDEERALAIRRGILPPLPGPGSTPGRYRVLGPRGDLLALVGRGPGDLKPGFLRVLAV